MPVGGGKGPAGGYRAGKKGSYGCNGYPTVSADGTVHGCHKTKTAAARQARAIWASVNSEKSDDLPPLTDFIKMKSVAENVEGCSGFAVVDEEGDLEACFQTREEAQAYADRENAMDMEDDEDDMSDDEMMKAKKIPSGIEGFIPASSATSVLDPSKQDNDTGSWYNPKPITETSAFQNEAETRDSINNEIGKQEELISEGDIVMGMTADGPVVGQVEHVMREGGVYGPPNSQYGIQSTPDNPAMAVRVFEEEDGVYYPTAYSIGMRYSDAQVVTGLPISMGNGASQEGMSKAESYSPNEGMRAAARRALRWKEEGKATGAGTPVGWGRATDIVAGRSMSLSVVRRMYSFFSRHEVDKKGKDFYNTSNPSNGRIMWDAWGGDAGFSWSRAIVERNKDKALFSDIFGVTGMAKAKENYASKRERSMETRRRLAESGQAMPDGSYPIVTVEDLRNAIQAFGRTDNPQATKEHIMRRARALGRTDLIPENWMGEKFWGIRDLTKTDKFIVKADSVRVGQMVSWNSSGGRAQGKVTRIIRSGSYNVPGTTVTINGTENDPAVVITLYRNGEATDTTVAHRMSTLRSM